LNRLNRLEKKLGRFAVKGLMNYIIGLTALVFFLMYIQPTGSVIERLMLNWAMIKQGEVWRLITYIFIPPTDSILWIVFVLYFYYMIGINLENHWGALRFNVFYLIGVIATTVAALLTGGSVTSVYLNLSLFLAFAHLFPNFELLLFFILPVKVKYLAWLQWAFIGWTVLTAPSIAEKTVAIVSVANYLIFFGRDLLTGVKLNQKAHVNKRRFLTEIKRTEPMHKCTICGKTEETDRKMDFRYCNTCEGDYEYCMDHLRNHEHIKKEG